MGLGAGKGKREGPLAKVLIGAWLFLSTLHAFSSYLVPDPNFPLRIPCPHLQFRCVGRADLIVTWLPGWFGIRLQTMRDLSVP